MSPSVGSQHDAAMFGVEQGKAGDVLAGVAEPDHHRHATRARQHRDMARRTALRQCDAAAGRPVGRQEARRRDVFAEQDRARRSAPVSGRGQRVEHLLADVLQVGSARAKIFVVRRLVAGDLNGQCSGPRCVCLSACTDRIERRTGERIVGKHGKLELQHVGGVAGRGGGKHSELLRCRLDRGLQRVGFRCRRTFGDIAGCIAVQAEDRAFRVAPRSGRSRQPKRSGHGLRPRPPRRNPARPARPEP